MPKKYLIFAAVICLDLAFIVFMRLESQSVEVSQAFDPGNLNSVPFVRSAEDSFTPSQDEDLSDTQSPLTDSNTHASNVKRAVDNGIWPSKRAGTVRKVRRPPLNSFTAKEPAVEFTDTIIWIPRSGYDQYGGLAVTAPSESTRNADSQSASKKKSIFSRAVPVIKKPYDWLKAFASRLR